MEKTILEKSMQPNHHHPLFRVGDANPSLRAHTQRRPPRELIFSHASVGAPRSPRRRCRCEVRRQKAPRHKTDIDPTYVQSDQVFYLVLNTSKLVDLFLYHPNLGGPSKHVKKSRRIGLSCIWSHVFLEHHVAHPKKRPSASSFSPLRTIRHQPERHHRHTMSTLPDMLHSSSS